MIVAILLHVTDLNCVGNPRCGIVVTDLTLLTLVFLLQVLFYVKFFVDFQRFLLLKLEFLLHLDLEASHGCVTLKLSGVKLASDTEFCVAFIALDSENHEHICLNCFWNVIIGEMDRLKCLALG